MNRNEYFAIRETLDFRKRPHRTVFFLIADCCLLIAADRLLRVSSPWAYLASQGLLVIAALHAFFIVHECGHRTAFDTETANVIVGHLASVLCLMPFYPWRFIHADHHTWSGNIHRDPTMKLVLNRQFPGRQPTPAADAILNLFWHSWLPLGALFQHFVFWRYPITLWREGKDRRRSRLSLLSIFFLAAALVALGHLLPSLANPRNLCLAGVLYLVATELINFPHHIGTTLDELTAESPRLRLWEQASTARSCYYPVGVSEIFFLNFNFHIEHHMFPDLPWHQLRKARERIRMKLDGVYHEEIGIDWNLKNRRRHVVDVFFNGRGK